MLYTILYTITRSSLAAIMLMLFAGGVTVAAVEAQDSAKKIDELKTKISGREQEIAELEKEIVQYQNNIAVLGNEAKTLKNAIKELDVSKKKLLADISITERKVEAKTFSIEKFGIEIGEKEIEIEKGNDAIAHVMRQIDETDAQSLVEVVLGSDSISSFWSEVSNLQDLQEVIRTNLRSLESLKADLEDKKAATERERAALVKLRSELADQKQFVESNKAEKNRLLASTQNKESNYKKILEEKLRLKEAFEREIEEFEAQLKIVIDPSRLPAVGSGVLNWPLASIRVSQYFGNTSFAQSGAYNGKGHNGIDLAAASGTKVLAAASGTVAGIGNTDTTPGCYSYGKWVLLTHDNGLSTLYAHLSLIKVSSGQRLMNGEPVGYSGNTGYSTGPHLHFTAYATQGVQIKKFDDSKNCKDQYIPVAPLNAYLNPLNYLKAL